MDDLRRTSSMLIADARRLRSSVSTFRVRRPQHTEDIFDQLIAERFALPYGRLVLGRRE